MKRVYYTGDIANNNGWFSADEAPHGFYKLTEEDGDLSEGRVFTIRSTMIGDVYAGHANPRFVTAEAYNTYRDAQIANFRLAIAR